MSTNFVNYLENVRITFDGNQNIVAISNDVCALHTAESEFIDSKIEFNFIENVYYSILYCASTKPFYVYHFV